jgi:DNA adenine methylase
VERRGLRPFLKWVGGKRQLLPVLRRFYPPSPGAYFEPFVGSGAVFFDQAAGGRLNGHAVTLSDANADLIGTYRRVGDAVDAVLDELDRLAAGHAEGGRDHYLRIRDQRFNPERAAWRDAGADLDGYPPALAAMLIYLNRTGYNGLYRVNASGEYNVPPGRYTRPRIVDRALLTVASAALKASPVRIEQAPFDRVLADAVAGDFVYFDPPYAPMSKTANFRGYTGRGFGDADQEQLQQLLIALAERGVHVLLSNSTAPAVTRLYEDNAAASRAGLVARRFPARRAVNSRADRRGAVDELVVSNIPPATDKYSHRLGTD